MAKLVLDGNFSSQDGLATANITDGTINTDAGDGVRVTAGELTLENVSVTTLGSDSYAIDANAKANITIEGGEFTTQGTRSDAFWVIDTSTVTLNNASVTTAGEYADGIVTQESGSATVTHSSLETQGDNAHGIYSENLIEGDDVTITTSGAGSAGVFAANGGTVTLQNSVITTSGQVAPGLLAYPGSSVSADNVQITTTGMQGFGLWSYAGTLNVSNSQITASGEEGSGLYVNGYSTDPALRNRVSLDNVTLETSQAQAIRVATTALTLEAKDSVLTGGNGQLMTVTHYEDTTDATNNRYSDVTFDAINSTLNGDISVSDTQNSVAVTLSSGSTLTGAVSQATALTIDNSSSWNMNNSSSVGQLTNNGTITFTDQSKFDTLSVTGDYAGDGGLLVMNSVLGDDTSPTNKLIVGGNVLAGTTQVEINNLGGYGAQTIEGIQIVDVGGTSLGSFAKSGRIVAGAYDYDLVKKGESWYLTSQLTPTDPVPDPTPSPAADPQITPTVEPENDPASSSEAAAQETPTVEPQSDPTPQPAAVPAIQPKIVPVIRPEGGSYTANLAAANTMFIMRLHDRLGETQFIDALSGQTEVTSLWLRQIGGHNRWRDGSGQLKTQSNRYMTQLGGDVARWSMNGADRWHIGFMAGYANDQSATVNGASGYRSQGEVKGYSIGGYATWYANQENHTGPWLDSWLQYSWFDNTVSGENLAEENYKSHGITASLEAGYSWKLGQFLGSKGTLNEWFIQPQAQAVWMGVRADDHQEANGTRISGDGDGNLMTRLGVKTWINSHNARDNDKQREFQPYVALNWLHNTRNFATAMDGVRVSQSGATNLGEVKVGVEGQINPRMNLWGNVGVQMGDDGYNDTAAMFGVKYNF